MGRIQILESALADQIAAGEVVERPASVVKELVENALDAGASSIHVEIDGEGVERIEVRDDGGGMDADDARLALQRHATSKLRAFSDLLALRTMGFRGEALASIASVSKLELRTRTREWDAGVQVRVEAGAAADVRPIGCPVGTTVRVEDLFFNVPARRKFLKSKATENGRVALALRRVALARPDLRLRLVRDGRTALEFLPVADTSQRLRQVFPQMEFLAVEGADRSARVRAWLGPSDKAQSGTGHLHLFVDGRPVQDVKIARAVAHAYRDTLPDGKYPSGVVFLELPSGAVDINVHPQKSEVRFANEGGVLDAVGTIVATALFKQEQARRAATREHRGSAARPKSFWNDRLGLGQLKHGEKIGTATAYRQGHEEASSAARPPVERAQPDGDAATAMRAPDAAPSPGAGDRPKAESARHPRRSEPCANGERESSSGTASRRSPSRQRVAPPATDAPPAHTSPPQRAPQGDEAASVRARLVRALSAVPEPTRGACGGAPDDRQQRASVGNRFVEGGIARPRASRRCEQRSAARRDGKQLGPTDRVVGGTRSLGRRSDPRAWTLAIAGAGNAARRWSCGRPPGPCTARSGRSRSTSREAG